MRAGLVGVDFGKGDFAASLDELSLLASSAGAVPTVTITGKRSSPDAALFVGSGKVQEIADAVLDDELEIVIFNHALSPAQQRNLERVLKLRVLDRTSLILDVFAQRAKSHEGKVQVELAQLQHLATRLIRGWTHLERQKGGIGLRGPGETQLETDRRLLGDRVKALRARLEKLHRQHATQRRARGRSSTISISLVGYTNAGKSTLFNALAKAGVYVAYQLFATLDTTSRRVYLGEAGSVVISDTVGFIRELPHQLVAAFRTTLEETICYCMWSMPPARRAWSRSSKSIWCSRKLAPIISRRFWCGTRLMRQNWRRRWNVMSMIKFNEFLLARKKVSVLICCGRQSSNL